MRNMASNLLIDTNVVLDMLLARDPFYKTARKVFRLNKQHDAALYVTASSVTDIYYLTRRELKDNAKTKALVVDLVTEMSIRVLTVSAEEIYMALSLPWKDFEDAVQYSTALLGGIDGIVTRDVEGFALSEIKVYTPKEIVETFNGE
ncbi:MAG: PIN domain-containing protein [Selenomonadaceae bacterium]|nr:PIN domain-containing protein [Selenomonadaceae bacterium]